MAAAPPRIQDRCTPPRNRWAVELLDLKPRFAGSPRRLPGGIILTFSGGKGRMER